MFHRICVTHLDDLSQETQYLFSAHGIQYVHHSVIQSKPRNFLSELPSGFFNAIGSSTAAIRTLASYRCRIEILGCIGPETAKFALSQGFQKSQLYYPDHDAYSLKTLCELIKTEFPSKIFYWLGSHQGLLKHQNTFAENPLIIPILSHWNWPDFDSAYELTQKYTEGCIISSSISSAIALGSLPFSQDIIFILSSERLKKYFCSSVSIMIPKTYWVNEVIALRSQYFLSNIL